MRPIVCSLLVLTAVACTDAQTAPGDQAPVQNQDTIAAEVGGRKITVQDVDQRWQSMDPAERSRVTQLVYQNRRNVLDQMVGDLLIEDAAKAAGMPVPQYVQQETSKRLQPITEADVQQFYEANKERAGGRTAAELQGPIREFLASQRQQQARAQLVDDLKKKSPSSVRVLLDPPRQTIEVAADDPAIGPATAAVTLVEFSDYQ